MGQIAVRIVNMKNFGKHAVLKVGELPARQHAPGVHGIAPLRFQGIPVRRDGRHQNAVAGFEVAHQRACFKHFAHSLVPKDKVVAVAHGAFPHGMHVRGAGRRRQGPDKRVKRPAGGRFFFNPTDCFQVEHGQTFHASLLAWPGAGWRGPVDVFRACLKGRSGWGLIQVIFFTCMKSQN